MTQMSVKSEDLKLEAFNICQEFLGDIWREITVSQFRFTQMSGGLSNTMYRCSLPENAVVKNPKTPKEVLLRIYGYLQAETSIVTEATTFMLLAERKLGPQLYGVFPKGRLEEFIPSRTLKTQDYRKTYKVIARELAKIHALDVPIRKVPDFWPKWMKRWLADVENEVASRTDVSFDLRDMYIEETAWLLQEIKKTNSPVVYCHNDLQGGNILLRQDSPSDEDPKLVLIDFEFGAYNYRGFDLAGQFMEWCFDYITEEFPFFTFNFEKYPSEEEQTDYIRAYLDQLVEEEVLLATQTEEELKNILEEITLFSMAVNLIWSLWSVKMSFRGILDFGHEEHGKIRRTAYFMFKEKYLKSFQCNGSPDLDS